MQISGMIQAMRYFSLTRRWHDSLVHHRQSCVIQDIRDGISYLAHHHTGAARFDIDALFALAETGLARTRQRR